VDLIRKGKLSNDTIIFNNLVSTIEELEKNWKIPASSSWLSPNV
jgi:hypothetical protein